MPRHWVPFSSAPTHSQVCGGGLAPRPIHYFTAIVAKIRDKFFSVDFYFDDNDTRTSDAYKGQEFKKTNM
jgi:hypothetical protein